MDNNIELSLTKDNNDTIDLEKGVILSGETNRQSLTELDIDKIIDKYKYYFDPNISFYKNYDVTIYNKLIDLKDNVKELNKIFSSDEFKETEEKLIPYLKKINLINLESKPIIHKLEKLVINTLIPDYNFNDVNWLENLAVAFNIEKYYKDCKIFFKDCPDYPINFQEPIFDPCKYPNILLIFNYFYEYCKDQRQMHSKAGVYFNRLNMCFLVPSLVLGSTGSVFSFLASTCFFSEKTQSIMSIIVGVLTCFVVLMQSFISAYQFDNKSYSHHKSADLYDQVITSIDFEKSYPSNTSFFKDLEKEIIKIKSNNPYLVPSFIKKQFYKKKEKSRYDNFVKDSIIDPSRKEIIESIQSRNKNMIINDNLDFLVNKLISINKAESSLTRNKYNNKFIDKKKI